MANNLVWALQRRASEDGQFSSAASLPLPPTAVGVVNESAAFAARRKRYFDIYGRSCRELRVLPSAGTQIAGL